MNAKGGKPVATRFRLRVLVGQASQGVHGRRSLAGDRPREGRRRRRHSGGAGVPTAPDGDCDGDGVKNGADLDDDNDLLADALELRSLLDPCAADSDGDGVEDGFEYRSALDLNNDDYQDAN